MSKINALSEEKVPSKSGSIIYSKSIEIYSEKNITSSNIKLSGFLVQTGKKHLLLDCEIVPVFMNGPVTYFSERSRSSLL